MNTKTELYDVVVVYSESIANSAGNRRYKEAAPFSSKSDIYNDSYRYFLLECKKQGVSAAFTTSRDIIGPGLFSNFWTYSSRGWVRNYKKAYSEVLFDKFTPISVKQERELKLLTSSKSIYTFSDKKIKNIFKNKLNTYKCFKEFAIPSVEIVNYSRQKIILAKFKLDKILKAHKHKVDFDSSFIIKDKTGTSGDKIHKVNFDKDFSEKIIREYKRDKKNKDLLSYILQPFINCDNGFKFGTHNGFIDLRLIILNHKIVQAYIRIAKKGNFKCNEHQGGNLIYMSLGDIPKEVLFMAGKIIKKLRANFNLKHSLYSLDFIKSNNGNLYFIEGNSNPGIDWDHKKKVNEKKTKELINFIVKELKLIVGEKLE